MFIISHPREIFCKLVNQTSLGLKQMESKLKSVDCILEVHDARIPFSGRNPKLAQKFAIPKPHILILNKADLIPSETRNSIKSALKSQQEIQNVIFTSSKNESCPGLRAVSTCLKYHPFLDTVLAQFFSCRLSKIQCS